MLPTMKKPHYAWVVMAACCCVIFTGIGIFNNSAGVFFRPIADSFGVGIGAVSMGQTIRSLASMAIMPFVPTLFARFGIKRTMAVAMILNCVCLALYAAIGTLWQFYVIGAVTGMCGPLLTNIPVPLIINNWFAKKTGAVLGIVLAFTGVGGAIMSPVASAIIERSGWRTAYMVVAAVGFVVAVPAILFALRVTPEEKGLLPYGFDAAAETAEAAPKPIGGERPMDFIHNPAFFAVLVFSLLITLVSALYSHMPGVAADLGFDTATGALTASVVMLGLIAGKLVIGGLSDKLGLENAIRMATLVGIGGTVLLMLGRGSYVLLMGGAALIGVSTALPSIATPLLITYVFGKKNYTVASSYVSLSTSLAGAVSVSLYGFLYDFTDSYQASLIFVMATLGLSVIALRAVMVRSARRAG